MGPVWRTLGTGGTVDGEGKLIMSIENEKYEQMP
jgi:hypothetical protein